MTFELPSFDEVTGLWRDRQGQPISFERWKEICSDEELRHVAADVVRTVHGFVYVSTIWTGMASFWSPMIYETMSFGPEGPDGEVNIIDDGSGRWGSLLEATYGHRLILDRMAQSWWTNLGGLA